ncbi:uncharacterized protein At4g02000-like [Eutrema salsugineum]|uniref:uncharacterized protein At4g02000-like n=1 Tax=Eutrema salsugineum TaxID=72664 RepID=UPI000CED6DFD|nr:uncharacterized protein At4g02000-like [Eutrema salsugineum]
MERSNKVANLPLPEEDDEIIDLPHVDNSQLIARFSWSLVGPMFNHEIRSTEAIIAFMPRPNIWDVEGRVHGIDLGNSRFQFDFDSEVDLQKVLNKRPCHFNKWSFSLERWIPHVGDSFPSNMVFWIRVSGIPTHFWLEDNFRTIGSSLGDVNAVDEHAARVRVSVNADAPLKFTTRARLQSGEVVKVDLKYEKPERWCLTCRHISHDEKTCPYLSEDQRREKRLEREAERNSAQAAREEQIRERDILFMRHQAGQISVPLRERNPLPPIHDDTPRTQLQPNEERNESHRERNDSRSTENRRLEDKRNSSVWNRIEQNPGYQSEARRYERREDDITPGHAEPPHTSDLSYRKRRYEDSFAASKGRLEKNKAKEKYPPRDYSSGKPPRAKFSSNAKTFLRFSTNSI